jgi:hypothetical protein
VGAGAVLAASGVFVVLAWFVLYWVDARRAYRRQAEAWATLVKSIIPSAGHLTAVELKEILAAAAKPPAGLVGLARALMAFTILSIVGVALFALLMANSADAGDLRQTLLASLTSVLATIIGFYFGARTSAPDTNEPAAASPEVR